MMMMMMMMVLVVVMMIIIYLVPILLSNSAYLNLQSHVTIHMCLPHTTSSDITPSA